MEYYTYVNIFATKGLEYLLLLAFLVLFIYLLKYLSGPPRKDAVAEDKGATPRRHAAGSGGRAARKTR